MSRSLRQSYPVSRVGWNVITPKQTALELRRISRILWVRVAIIAALSLLAALSAPLWDWILPTTSKDRFTEAATLPVLNILANGMLVVATFSLGVMVSSHRTLATNTTPRIHRLLMEDTSTQSMLATFIGAFVFSLSSIILFRANYYSDSAAFAVFAATVIVVLAIVVSLVRWIHKLSRIGSIDYALERAEDTARETLRAHRKLPTLGAHFLASRDDVPDGTEAVVAQGSGYLRTVDVQALQEHADENGAEIYVLVLPGDRVLSDQSIAAVSGAHEAKTVADAFSIATSRSYEQDPRYCLQALRETASKALSPGINDPGTAVEVITRLEILLHDFFSADKADEDVPHDRVHMPAIHSSDLIETAFRDLASDGASHVSVLSNIKVALKTMESHKVDGTQDCLASLESELSEHAEAGLKTNAERERFQSHSA